MKKTFLPIVLAIAVFGAGAGLIFFFKPVGSIGTIAPSALSGALPYTGPPLSQKYQDGRLNFSVMMPDGFTAQQLPDDGGGATTILLQNGSGDGIQIQTTPFPDDTHDLTAAQIQQDIPELTITDIQDVAIGPQYKGVAFKSDNDAFGGASREVWFVYNGTLYQISTYQRLDPLLQAMFATWKFF